MAKIYIDVPFAEKERAKEAAKLPDGAAGIAWDGRAGAWWFDDKQVDRQRMLPWLDRPVRTEHDAKQEFKAALLNAGLVFEGDPVMDGEWQKTGADGSEEKYKGAYKGNITAKSANGYFQNFFTGERSGWQYEQQFTPMVLRGNASLFREDGEKTPLDRSERVAELAMNLAAAKEQTEQEYLGVAQKVADSLLKLPDVAPNNPYNVKKGIPALPGVKQLRDLAVIPLQDADGKIWSAQYIFPSEKNLRKGGKKTGCFFQIGAFDSGTTVLFCEGYATGASLHLATGLPVVVCIDSGNIHAVAASLAPKLLDKTLLFCGDDDRLTTDVVMSRVNKLKLQDTMRIDQFALEALPPAGVPFYAKGGEGAWKVVEGENDIDRVAVTFKNDAGAEKQMLIPNVGREKSVAAALEFGGTSVFPAFQEEKRGLTDFNDLHLAEGLDAVKSQIVHAIGLKQSLNALAVWAYQTYGTDVELRTEVGKVHSGAFVQHTGAHSAQDIGKKKLIAHATQRLDKVPLVGQVVRVNDGQIVSPLQNKSKEQGHQR